MATEKTQSAAPAGKQKKPQQQKNKQKQKVVPHRDQYQRISFLYQAATHMAADPATDPLARIYAQTMKATAKKSVLRLSPQVKRSVCKKCNRVLLDGLSVSTRITNSSRDNLPHCDVLEKTCVCGVSKRFPIGQDRAYRLFGEQDPVQPNRSES